MSGLSEFSLDSTDGTLAEKWLSASRTARKSEHHFPADCLEEAVEVCGHLLAQLTAAREALSSLLSTDGTVSDLDTLAALERAARETGWTANELTDALAILTPIIATELAAAQEALALARGLLAAYGDAEGEGESEFLLYQLTAALDGPSDGGGV